MHTKIITILIVGAVAFTAVTAFSAEDYNSSRSNTSIAPTLTTIESEQVLPTAVYPTPTQTNIKQPPFIQRPTTVSESAPSVTSQVVVKKCGVNTFGVSNECGAGAFKNLYFQCYDGHEEKLGGESSCKSSSVWRDYARSVCVNRCGVAPASSSISPNLSESQGGQTSIAVPIKPLPTLIEAKPITICYIPDKLTKDYNQFLLNLRKAESGGDKTTAEEIIKKITALKLETERYRKNCLTNTFQLKPVQPSIETTSSLGPVAIDRCREVTRWENKIAYYEKLSGLSGADLKGQTGFSREEIEKILVNLPVGLETGQRAGVRRLVECTHVGDGADLGRARLR